MCHNDLCALRKETKLSTVNTVAFRPSPSQQKYHGCTHDHSGKRDKADMSQNHRMYLEFSGLYVSNASICEFYSMLKFFDYFEFLTQNLSKFFLPNFRKCTRHDSDVGLVDNRAFPYT